MHDNPVGSSTGKPQCLLNDRLEGEPRLGRVTPAHCEQRSRAQSSGDAAERSTSRTRPPSRPAIASDSRRRAGAFCHARPRTCRTRPRSVRLWRRVDVDGHRPRRQPHGDVARRERDDIDGLSFMLDLQERVSGPSQLWTDAGIPMAASWSGHSGRNRLCPGDQGLRRRRASLTEIWAHRSLKRPCQRGQTPQPVPQTSSKPGERGGVDDVWRRHARLGFHTPE